MKFSNYNTFSADFLNKGLDEAIKLTVDLGIGYVEHRESINKGVYKIGSIEEARTMRKKLDDNGLGVSCYSVVANLCGEDGDHYLDELYRHIEYAAIIGSPFIHHTLTAGFMPDTVKLTTLEALDLAKERAEKVANRCNEYGMICLYEPQGFYFNGVEGVEAIINEMRSRGCKVGVCGDTGNSIYFDCMPTEIFRAFKDDILHIHVKDRRYGLDETSKMLTREGKTVNSARLGEGNIGVIEALSLVPEYDGILSLEFDDTDEEIKRTMDELNKLFGK